MTKNGSSRIVSQKSILKTALFELREDEILLPTGTRKKHMNMYRVPVVCVFPITESGDIYLLSQYRYLYGKTSLEEVAGHVDEGEEPLAAAKRELREEAGLIAKRWTLFTKVEHSGSVIKTELYFYLAQDITEDTPFPEEEEEIEIVKMPLAEAVAKILSGEISRSAIMLGILFIDKMKQEGKI